MAGMAEVSLLIAPNITGEGEAHMDDERAGPGGADPVLWLASAVYALGLATLRGFEQVLGAGAAGSATVRGVRARVGVTPESAEQDVDYGTLLDHLCGGGVETVDLNGSAGFGDGLCSAVAGCVGRGLVRRVIDVSECGLSLAGLYVLAGSLRTNETCGVVCHGQVESREQQASVVTRWRRKHGAGVVSRVDLGKVPESPLPLAMRLPALEVGVDLGALRWGEPVTLDTDGRPRLPSVAALDDDRLVVAWLRFGPETNHMRAVRRSDGSLGPIVDTGSQTFPFLIQERRIAPLGADRCVVVERQRERRMVCRRAYVGGLAVTLDDATELGGRCGLVSDVYRLDNGLYVVSGHGVGVGGEAGRAGVYVVRVGLDGRVEVVGRRAVGVTTSHLSLMVSRSRNRVCVARAGGVSVVHVGRSGEMASCGELAVAGYDTGEADYPWYRGVGVDLGGGRVVQLNCSSSQPELVVVDVGGSGVSAHAVGTVRKHEPGAGGRRACTAGAHLVLPGGAGRGSAPVDIVRVAAADPAAWSRVRRHTIPDVPSESMLPFPLFPPLPPPRV